MSRLILAGLFFLGCAVAGATDHQAIFAAFRAASLPVHEPIAMSPDDYGMGPVVCSGQRFKLDADKNGRLFLCDDADEQSVLADYYIELGKASALFFSWVFQHGPWVLQLNGELPEAQAKGFDATLQSIVNP